jgi:Ca-activated chloride channel family protein
VRPLVWCLYFLACLTVPAGASAWSPLRGENSNAKKGNTLMAQEQYGPALEAYDEAARELPEARAVQLNRGLALLAQDLGEQAKEAFLAAADPKAAPTTRADAYYDLGIAHAREGDAISQQEEYEQASAHFREAADAFKRSLRQRPGDRNAAWNLEYAMKRIREEEEKQEQQEQQEEQQEQQDQEQEQDSENESQDQEQEQDSENESQEQEQQPQPVPQDEVQRFLDALEQNEENLPLQRARRRNAGRPPPEKDW